MIFAHSIPLPPAQAVACHHRAGKGGDKRRKLADRGQHPMKIVYAVGATVRHGWASANRVRPSNVTTSESAATHREYHGWEQTSRPEMGE